LYQSGIRLVFRNTSLRSDAELVTLRQAILAAARDEARLETSPARGLLDIMDTIDRETGSLDRWTRLYCSRAEIDPQMQFVLIQDDLRPTLNDPMSAQDALSCSRDGDGAICRLRMPLRADGGPRLLEMMFRRDRHAHWMLDTMVHTDPGNRRRYINAHLRHSHVCN